MPTLKTRFNIILTADEKAALTAKSEKAGFKSLAEFIRARLDLAPIKRGGRTGNKNAVKSLTID